MPQDDDFMYRKDLSEERIRELENQAKAHRYEQHCITAAIVGIVIFILAALLLGISLSVIYILVGGLGATAGYAFYALGKYVEEKHKDDGPAE